MRPEILIEELRQKGVQLQPRGERLRYWPVERVPPELLNELKAHKGEILRILEVGSVATGLGGVQAPTVTAGEVCAMPLSEFAEAGLVVEVRSEVLGEVVIFASDNAVVDPGERRVVYWAAELRTLLGVGGDDLRRLHAAKRAFGGTVVPS